MKLLKRLFDHDYKELNRFKKIADEIMLLDEEYSKLTDKKLKNNSACKILDPSCGSGVFLVESLRRIIDKHIIIEIIILGSYKSGKLINVEGNETINK